MAEIKNGLGPDHIVKEVDPILLGNAVKPTEFIGEGRPDIDTSVHTGDEWAMLEAAPPGSSYVCTKPEDNFGAQVWRKGTEWVCVEGRCEWLIPDDHFYPNHTSKSSSEQNSVVRTPDTVFVNIYAETTASGAIAVRLDETCFVVSSYDMMHGVSATDQFSIGLRRSRVAVSSLESSSYSSYSGGYMGQLSAPALYPHLWPTGPLTTDPNARRDELRELIESEVDPDKLQQLKQELEALERL